ncbi:MAG: FMN-binding protein [Pseudomonadales bacterium]
MSIFARIGLLVALAMSLPVFCHAENYLSSEEFLAETFAGVEPEAHKLWLSQTYKEAGGEIFSHQPSALRLRYWQLGERTAWIIEEIGKVKPITVGTVVGPEGIEQVKILAFRESRGWEVRYPFFTDQYRGAKLQDKYQLDRRIDGITGATLSVRAVNRVARWALYLHQQVMADG